MIVIRCIKEKFPISKILRKIMWTFLNFNIGYIFSSSNIPGPYDLWCDWPFIFITSTRTETDIIGRDYDDGWIERVRAMICDNNYVTFLNIKIKFSSREILQAHHVCQVDCIVGLNPSNSSLKKQKAYSKKWPNLKFMLNRLLILPRVWSI